MRKNVTEEEVQYTMKVLREEREKKAAKKARKEKRKRKNRSWKKHWHNSSFRRKNLWENRILSVCVSDMSSRLPMIEKYRRREPVPNAIAIVFDRSRKRKRQEGGNIMSTIFNVLQEKIPEWRFEVKSLLEKKGIKDISSVTVNQAYGGMRGVKGLVCDTSAVDPDKGLIIRGRPLLEITDILPEEVFYLLLTGELPDEAALKDLQKQYAQHVDVPQYVWDVLKAMPEDSHPMTMFDTAILAMEKESMFRQEYDKGLQKQEYWRYILEDGIRLIAKLPNIGAGVYRIRFNKGDLIAPDKSLDWGANFAHQLGIDDPDGTLKN